MNVGAPALALSQVDASPEAATALRFRVEDWAACRMLGAAEAEWLGPSAGSAVPALPTALRRRVSAIGQKAFQAAWRLPVSDDARFIFCSRHGEYARTASLLEALAAAEPTSPADFSLSVHHALAGLLSIARANGAGHSTVAAGPDSFGFGLFEAAACLAAGSERQVLLVYFDEPLPADYAALCDEKDGFAAAFLLGPGRRDDRDIVLSCSPPETRLPQRSATNQARDFAEFLRSGECERQSRGGRVQWRWSHGRS